MNFDFQPISTEHQQNYISLFHKCTQLASDYSFINLWSWADEYDLEWAWAKGLVWIRQNKPNLSLWAPVGQWEAVDWRQLFSDSFEHSTRLIRVPEALIQIWKGIPDLSIEVTPTRGAWDYLHSVAELSDLKGNRFHKKKNLVNQFKNKYQFEYHAIDAEMVMRAQKMQSDWCEWRDCESHETLAAENRAIERVLEQWSRFDSLLGGAVIVDDQIVCYTIAEPVGADTIVIHFEKGNPALKGSYQAISQLFLTQHQNRFTWVNREQDLDYEGLRKAKLSYHPTDFIKKSNVVVKRL